MSGELEFEHIGTMVLDEALLLCDVEYLPPRYAGMHAGAVSLGLEIAVEPGTWQLLLAYSRETLAAGGEEGAGPSPDFVLLTHEGELDDDLPLDQAEALGLLRVDSGRFTAVDPQLRGEVDILRAVLEAPREQVPCMLRPPADMVSGQGEPRGALIDLDRAGVFAIYGPPGVPRRAVFFAVSPE